MTTFTTNVIQAGSKNSRRIASLAMAAVLTLAMLASVNGLAVMDAPAPVMAQGAASQAS